MIPTRNTRDEGNSKCAETSILVSGGGEGYHVGRTAASMMRVSNLSESPYRQVCDCLVASDAMLATTAVVR